MYIHKIHTFISICIYIHTIHTYIHIQDAWLVMEKIRTAHKGRERSQIGVPEAFKEVVLDSRKWLQERDDRLASIMENVCFFWGGQGFIFEFAQMSLRARRPVC